jgi:hypothetical protein
MKVLLIVIFRFSISHCFLVQLRNVFDQIRQGRNARLEVRFISILQFVMVARRS